MLKRRKNPLKKSFQIELWEDCNNNCSFCYLGKNRNNTSSKEKYNRLCQSIEIIKKQDYNYFDTIGLIGGEFLQNQLSEIFVYEKYQELINLIKEKLINNELRQIWIAASLLKPCWLHIYNTFDILCKDLKKNQQILLCTSYNESGRFFKTNEIWKLNKRVIQEKYSKVIIHNQYTLSQDFINMCLSSNFLINLPKKDEMHDFHFPYILQKDFLNIKSEDYHNILLQKKNEFQDNFFIESRESFLKLIYKLLQAFPKEKILNISKNFMRADKSYYLTSNLCINDKWNENSSDNLSCGHTKWSKCYIDSDKCAACDIINYCE